jgi:hypothetical protein
MSYWNKIKGLFNTQDRGPVDLGALEEFREVNDQCDVVLEMVANLDHEKVFESKSDLHGDMVKLLGDSFELLTSTFSKIGLSNPVRVDALQLYEVYGKLYKHHLNSFAESARAFLSKLPSSSNGVDFDEIRSNVETTEMEASVRVMIIDTALHCAKSARP